jgi:hydroxypyruvate reductase
MSLGIKDNGAEAMLACWHAGVAAANPASAVGHALDELAGPVRAPWIIALGKAAHPMVEAAVSWLDRHGGRPAGGLVVAADTGRGHALPSLTGDHPLPGERSSNAARALAEFCRSLPPSAPVWVLLSGGTSSLIAGPAEGLTERDLRDSYQVLLESGLDIRAMNRVRKRLSRWGGGQLLAALGHRPILQLAVSDVPGDDLSVIGSGPLIPDATPPADLVRDLEAAGLLERFPPRAAARIQAASIPAAPGPNGPGNLASRIVASNRLAVAAAAAAARRRGWEVAEWPEYLQGEAAPCGRALVDAVMSLPGSGPLVLVAGGETTVTLPAGHRDGGGRCQELALAAAAEIHRMAAPVILIAGGTDGRDGPTDAAGAVVDGATWQRITRSGIDPAVALAGHASHHALAAAGCLFQTGPTGTNVADLILVLRGADQAAATTAGPSVR